MMAGDCNESPAAKVATAVAIAALTALFTKAAEWAVEELRDRYGTKPEREERKGKKRK